MPVGPFGDREIRVGLHAPAPGPQDVVGAVETLVDPGQVIVGILMQARPGVSIGIQS